MDIWLESARAHTLVYEIKNSQQTPARPKVYITNSLAIRKKTATKQSGALDVLIDAWKYREIIVLFFRNAAR